MNRTALLLLCVAVTTGAQTIPLRPDGIDAHGQKLEDATYKGRKAVRFIEKGEGVGLLPGTDFHNGTLEVDIAAMPAQGAPGDARGFAGLAFRIQDRAHYEGIYIRPTNGRADDQLRRNHSTQYISEPEWPWNRLRTEAPGVYESYADMEPGVWIHFKVVVAGQRAELYLNDATQPCLVVKDMKKGDSHGPIGLWIGAGTEAYFSNLKVTKKD